MIFLAKQRVRFGLSWCTEWAAKWYALLLLLLLLLVVFTLKTVPAPSTQYPSLSALIQH